MKLQSLKVKNQVVNMLQPVGKVLFDKEGFCEVEDQYVDIVLENYGHFDFVQKKKVVAKEKVEEPFDVKSFSFTNEQIGQIKVYGKTGLAQIVIEIGREITHDQLELLYEYVSSLEYKEAHHSEIVSFHEQKLFSLTNDQITEVVEHGPAKLGFILTQKGVNCTKSEVEFWAKEILDANDNSKTGEFSLSDIEVVAIKTIDDLRKIFDSNNVKYDENSLVKEFEKVVTQKEVLIEKSRVENTKKINGINSVSKLKELCSDFPEVEWSTLQTKEELKTYLISKL